MTSCPEIILSALDIVEEASRFRVRVFEDTEVPVGDTLVKVLVGVNEGNVCTKPRQHSMGKVDYAIASMVLRNGTGYLKVVNVGVEPFIWKKGEVVTRAERCEEMTEVSSKIFSLRNVSEVTEESDIVGGIKYSEINVGCLEDCFKKRLFCLLRDYGDCFASSAAEIGLTSLGVMHINLTTDKPINRKPYRLAYTERDIVAKKIKELLEGNIIRESNSEYASPIILVRKKMVTIGYA
ncbi:unnamed protein product [Parnassius mnemosyne]|uniref:Uncharacterized protein n=1 Tax=Parnassius mnemosyne TaxID=213953 RepID=A0AAV1KC94_9NEOP